MTDIPGSSDVSVGKGRSVLPGDRSHELSSLPDSAKPNRTRRRSGLSPRPHFRFCRPGRGTSPDDTRGIRLSFSLSFFGALPELQPAGASRSPGLKTERCGSEGRCVRMSDRPGMPVPVRPVGQPACTRAAASSEASYSVRTDTAIIYLIMWRTYPPRSCDISQPRLAACRPRIRPASGHEVSADGRKLVRESESIGNAKAGTSGHMIRDGDGLRVVSGISVRFPFSARRGRPRRAV